MKPKEAFYQFSPKDWICQFDLKVLILFAWALVVIQLLASTWSHGWPGLIGPDDALRLVEVRNWLAGQGWYNLHFSRLDPPLGYNSQWSRLIDAGLGGLFLLFHLFATTRVAELLMEQVWPLLWLLPAIIGVVAIAYRLRGRDAALMTLLFIVAARPAMFQFLPGRIDHHNVQIALAVLAVAATVWSDRIPWTAWAAGIATGLGITIGIEAIPFHFLCGAAFAVRYILDPRAAAALRRYGLAVAVATGAGFLATVGPNHWSDTFCDAIAVNNVIPVVLAGFLFAVAGSFFINVRLLVRCGLIVAIGTIAFVTFALIEPRCLAGPFGMIDPAIKPIWLVYVNEMRSALTILVKTPLLGLLFITTPLISIIAGTFFLIGAQNTRKDFGFWVSAATVLLATVTTFAAVRWSPYGDWLGIPMVASAAEWLFGKIRLRSHLSQVAAALILVLATPSGTYVALTGIKRLEVGTGNVDHPHISKSGSESGACVEEKSYKSIAQLPIGLVVTDIDLGSFVLAYTPLSVVAAPYNRLGNAMVLAYEALTLPPNLSHHIITRIHANYVLICNSLAPPGLTEAQRSASLWGQLHRGMIPKWLEPVNDSKKRALSVYRVKP